MLFVGFFFFCLFVFFFLLLLLLCVNFFLFLFWFGFCFFLGFGLGLYFLLDLYPRPAFIYEYRKERLAVRAFTDSVCVASVSMHLILPRTTFIATA